MAQFPGGEKIAVISSWTGGDDAANQRIADMLEQYGWKGAFIFSAGTANSPTPQGLAALVSRGMDIGWTPESAAAVLEERTKAESTFGVPVLVGDASSGKTEPSELSGGGFQAGRSPAINGPITASVTHSGMAIPCTAHVLAEHGDLRERWEQIEDLDGGILHLYGDVHDCGEDDDAWASLECNLAWFCGMTGVWYPSYLELAKACR